MMRRLLLGLLTAALLPAAAAHARGGTAPPTATSGGFAQDMLRQLAIDPAGAQDAAELELRRQRGGVDTGDTLWVLAQAHFRQGDTAATQSALARLRRHGELPGTDRRTARRIAGHVALLSGMIAQMGGDISRALPLLRTAQARYIAAQYPRGHGQALQALATLYANGGDGENALRYLNLARETYDGDIVYRLSLANNLGVAHHKLEQYDEALVDYQRALALARALGNQGIVDQLLINVITTQLLAGRLDAAAAALATLPAERAGRSALIERERARLIALLALRRGDVARAVQLITPLVQDIDVLNSDMQYYTLHRSAYEIYEASGNARASLAHLSAIRRLDALDAATISSNRSALIAAQFQFATQEARIVELRAQQLSRQVEFERQRANLQQSLLILAIIGGIIALALLTSLLLVMMRARNRAQDDRARLSILNDELAGALAAKSEFLAATSHEMRTPLNGILGMTQVLKAGNATREAAVARQIDLIHSAGTSLRKLVDDLLDAAKIERGGFTVTPEAADAAALINGLVDRLRDSAAQAQLTLATEITLPAERVMLDPQRLEQLLCNLVGNAIKFTRAGGVVVRAYRRDGDAQALVIDVVDTGDGVAPDAQERIFELFHQLDATRARSFGGTGLGLAICRQLARAMGGDVTVRSEPGAGSTFTLRMPYTGAPAAADEAAAPHDAAAPSIIVHAHQPLRAAMLRRLAGDAAAGAEEGAEPSAVAEALVAALRQAEDGRVGLLTDAAGAAAMRPLLAAFPADQAARIGVIIAGPEATGAADEAPLAAAPGWREWRVPMTINAVRAAIMQCLDDTAVNGTMAEASIQQRVSGARVAATTHAGRTGKGARG